MPDKDTRRPPVKITAQEPAPNPPKENAAEWVEKYANWATQVVVAHAAIENKDD
jgi:hypothetical protein